jgi:outer membrane protein assembly factor BamD
MGISKRRIAFFFSLLLLGASLSSGCSSTRNTGSSGAKGLYEDAVDDMDDERFTLALEKLRKLKSKYPYSKFAVLSRLSIADVYFKQESYEEAAASYEIFRDLHPKHEKAGYAAYQIGESYFKATPSNPARDQTLATKALFSFEDFLKTYPTGELAKEGEKRIADIREQLASKERYIADYYYGQGEYRAALGRYEKLKQFYPKTESAKSIAANRLEKTRKRAAEQEAEEKRQREEESKE